MSSNLKESPSIDKPSPDFGFWQYRTLDRSFLLDAFCMKSLGLHHGASFQWDELHALLRNKEDFELFTKQTFRYRGSSSVILVFQDESRENMRISAAYQELDQSIHGSLELLMPENRRVDWYLTSEKLNRKVEIMTKTAVFEWVLSEDSLRCSDNFFKITQLEGHNNRNHLDVDVFFNLIEKDKQNFVLDVMHECIVNNEEFEVSFFTANQSHKRLKLYGYPEGDVQSKKLVGFIYDISDNNDFNESIIRGQDLERKRLSMELHDSVGQKLVAMKYMMALFKISNDLSGIDKLNESMNEAIDEIRSITHDLSSEVVNELGLEKAIQQLLEKTGSGLNSAYTFNYELPQGLDLQEDVSKMLYRIIQEALSNAMKHSKAKALTLNIKYQNKQIIMEITDNGQGFDVSKTAAFGIGLRNIKQRVTFLNGFIKIASNIGEGTTIKIKVPA